MTLTPVAMAPSFPSSSAASLTYGFPASELVISVSVSGAPSITSSNSSFAAGSVLFPLEVVILLKALLK